MNFNEFVNEVKDNIKLFYQGIMRMQRYQRWSVRN